MSRNDRISQQIVLSDGRHLGFAEYGDLQGRPVFLFAGMNNARLIRHPDDSLITVLGIHLITTDRPGMGLSDFQVNRRLLDWPDDIRQLADALHLDRFAVVGASAGGPYAAACAYKIPHRLTSATLVSSVAPVTVPALFASLSRSIKLQIVLAERAPLALAGMYRAMRWLLQRWPEQLLRRLMQHLPARDQEIVREAGHLPLLVQDLQEGLRQGGYGSAYDLRVISRSWGFRLEEIGIPVYLWQGDDDPQVPLAMGQYLAATIPNCRATFVPGAGHLLIYSHWQAILAQAGRGA
jgi:pimeloyl-ACP methyl ester carboxylesterase